MTYEVVIEYAQTYARLAERHVQPIDDSERMFERYVQMSVLYSHLARAIVTRPTND